MLLMTFLSTAVLTVVSLQMTQINIGFATGNKAFNWITAQDIASSALSLAQADILSKLDSGTLDPATYNFTGNMAIPDDPANLAGASTSAGSYTATIVQWNGNSYLVKVVATSGSSTAEATRVMDITPTIPIRRGIRFMGRDANNQTGYNTRPAGDVDNDGFEDILMSATSAISDLNTGEVYLVFGRSSSEWKVLGGLNGDFDLDNMSRTNRMVRFIGRSDGDYTGERAMSVGDVNNDNYGDFIIGADWSDNGTGTTSKYGEAFLVFGRPASEWNTFGAANGDYSLSASTKADKIYRFYGKSSSEFATGVGYGDVDGDGYDDILIGAHAADDPLPNVGEVYIIFGRSQANWDALVTAANGDFSMANANVTFAKGIVRLLGRTNTGTPTSSGCGWDVQASNINGDNISGEPVDDIIIGCTYSDMGGTDRGEVIVAFGRSRANWDAITDADGTFQFDGGDTYGGISETNDMMYFKSRADSTQLGTSVGESGDLDGDGIEDLVFGTNMGDANGVGDSGETYIFFGRNMAGWDALTAANGEIDLATSLSGMSAYRFVGGLSGIGAGRSASASHDVNQDGYADLLIGAWNADGGGTNSGEIYLIFGRSTANWATLIPAASKERGLNTLVKADKMVKFVGKAANTQMGHACSSVGDINGDGTDDLLLGAYNAEVGADTDAGEVYLMFGRSLTLWDAMTDASGNFSMASSL